MRRSLRDTLMRKDGISAEEADAQIESVREELYDRLDDGEMPFEICAERFGLEPDYLDDLI